MKKTLFLIVLFSLSLKAQAYDQYNQIYSGALLERTTSASSEALGKSFFNFESNSFSFKTNPAMVPDGNNAEAGFSYSLPYSYNGMDDGSYYNYMGVKASPGSLGSFGFSRYYLKIFEIEKKTIEHPDGGIGMSIWDESVYSLAYSREIAKGLYLGSLINYMHANYGDAKFDNVSLGIGAAKTFELNPIGSISHSIGVGLSFENLIEVYQKNNYGALALPLDAPQDEEIEVVLPQRVNASLSYKADAGILSLKMQVEYRDLLNSAYLTEVSEGLELGVYDMLFLRVGNYNYRTNNKFTYGFGVKLGEFVFKNIAPIELAFDYARPNYKDSNNYYNPTEDDEKKFDIYSLNLSYSF